MSTEATAAMTAEAPTLEAAFGGKTDYAIIEFGAKELKTGYEMLHSGNNRNNNRHSLSCPLTREESYQNDHLTHAAFVSIAILTFITFVGNFTQLQLSAALPTIVSDFGISVTTGQWLTSIFQLVMGVMVPLTAYLTRRFSTRQIVIASMAVFTLGSVFAWLGSSFVLVLIGRLLEAVGTGVMWPVLQITVFSIYPLSRRGMAMGTVGMAMSVAPAIGPTLGGVQTDLNGWRSIFLTLTVIGVISLFLAIFGLRNFGTRDASAKADFFSVGLSIFGFGGLMFGFTDIGCTSFLYGCAGLLYCKIPYSALTVRMRSTLSSMRDCVSVPSATAALTASNAPCRSDGMRIMSHPAASACTAASPAE